MRTTYDIEQGTDKWFALRLGVFTSSQIANLMTEPRSKKDKEAGLLSQTAISYIESKAVEVIYGYQDTFTNAAMTYGNENEQNAKDAYEVINGTSLTDGNFIKLGEFTGSSPDAYTEDGRGLVEIKCPYNPANHLQNCIKLKDDTDLFKHHKQYYYQVHHQLWIADKEYCDFVSFDPRLLSSDLYYRKALHSIRIERNRELDAIFEEKINKAGEQRDLIIDNFING